MKEDDSCEESQIKVCLVEKLNEIGLLYNKRILILSKGDYLGYSKDLTLENKLSSINKSSCKVAIPIQKLMRVTNDATQLGINFLSKEGYLCTYTFQFPDENIAKQWHKDIELELRRRVKKSTKLTGRRSNSNIQHGQKNLNLDR